MARRTRERLARWATRCLPLAALVLVLHLAGDDERAGGAPPLDRSRAVRATDDRPPASTARTQSLAQVAPLRQGARAGDADRPLSPRPGSALTGRVLDVLGRAVAGARVALHAAPPPGEAPAEPLLTVETDAGGAFQLAAPPHARLAVSAQAAGYAPARREEVVAGAYVELVLGEAAELLVEVRSAAAEPCPGARVRAGRPGRYRERVTEADGRAAFEALPAGPVEVLVATAGGAFARRLVVLVAGDPCRLVLRLPAGQELRGTVSDRDTGRALAGVTVRLAGLEPAVPTTTSDAQGRFTLALAAPVGRPVSLVAARQGYAEARVALDPRFGPAGPQVLRVALWPERTLRGRVVDEAGRGVRGARLAWAADAAPEQVTAGSRGRFRVPLPPAPSEGGVFALLARTDDGRVGASAVRLDPAGGELEVVLRDVGLLSGVVRGASNAGVAGAVITLEPSDAFLPGLVADPDEAWARQRALAALAQRGLAPRAVSDAEGRYHLPRIPVGAWTIRLAHAAAEERLAEPVRMLPGAVISRDLFVHEHAAVEGRVVDRVGQPVAGAHVLTQPVRATPAGSGAAATLSGPDGCFRIEGIDAQVPVDLLVSADGLASTRVPDVLPGTRRFDVRLEPSARLEGRVTAAGAPYAKPVELWLLPARAIEGAQASAPWAVAVPALRDALVRSEHAEGRFAIDLPGGGPWLLCARSADGSQASVPLEVTGADAEASDTEVRLLPAATLAGRLGRGRAIVSLHAWSGRGLVARPLAAVPAAQDGSFLLPGLAPGRWTLVVAGPGGHSLRQSVRLGEGATLDLDLTRRAGP